MEFQCREDRGTVAERHGLNMIHLCAMAAIVDKSEVEMKSVSQMEGKQSSNAAKRRRITRLTESFVAPRLSVEERIAVGKSLRAKVPRSVHAELALADNREPIGTILEQAKSRVSQLVPIRHARMLASPFAFLRGAAAVMAADLAHTQSTGVRLIGSGLNE